MDVVNQAKASAPEAVQQAEARVALAKETGDLGALPASARSIQIWSGTKKVQIPLSSLEPVLAALDEEDEAALSDPNLALVAIRIDIERRVSALAEMVGIRARGLGRKVAALQARGVFSDDFAGVLSRFIQLGNQAAHGAVVEPGSAKDILSGRRLVLSTLDTILDEVARESANDEQLADKAP